MFGKDHNAWLKETLNISTATWKVWGNSGARWIGGPTRRTSRPALRRRLGPAGSGYAGFGGGDYPAPTWNAPKIYELVRDAKLTGFATVSATDTASGGRRRRGPSTGQVRAGRAELRRRVPRQSQRHGGPRAQSRRGPSAPGAVSSRQRGGARRTGPTTCCSGTGSVARIRQELRPQARPIAVQPGLLRTSSSSISEVTVTRRSDCRPMRCGPSSTRIPRPITRSDRPDGGPRSGIHDL